MSQPVHCLTSAGVSKSQAW